jgi:hypothetical protein
MAHGTGMFKQRDFLEKLRRLEAEVASTKAAAEEMARKAIERSAQSKVPPESDSAATLPEDKPKA